MVRGRSGLAGIGTLLVLVWLVIGAVAAGQRHYFDDAPTNCAGTSTIAVTILAGPLNYMGVNPKIDDCNVDVPQPSQ
ncbi:hypothetical protein AB0L82_14250 [Nocardia sp. NPDC052001]|uniref:hypothetical protein n=1 Tax=Nocardia sp. NPDC052001 TaxID=3154853 RepID=UPI0034336BD8